MTTSGTTTWNPGLGEIIEEAAERAGFELRSGYQLRTAVRTANFLAAEWASRGLNLWTIDTQTLNLTTGVNTYTLPADTIDVIECEWRQNPGTINQLDVQIERFSVSQYAQITNKLATGIPINYYVQRLADAPVIQFYFTPDQPYTVQYWRLRRMQDAGGVTNTIDVPFRFIPAFTAGLAFMLASKKIGAEQRALALKPLYDEAFQLAADEDRDRASVWFLPWTGDIY